jgi:hypothetical protein
VDADIDVADTHTVGDNYMANTRAVVQCVADAHTVVAC